MKNKTLKAKLFALATGIILATVVTPPAVASPATATRTLPAAVMSGTQFDIFIEVSGCGLFGQVIETLPEGFTYLSCNSSDLEVELIGNTVKFTFLGDSASFTYRVEAPIVGALTAYTFQGVILNEDRIPHPIADDEVLVTDEDNPPIAIALASVYSNLVLVYGYCPGEGSGGWTIYKPEWAETHPSWNTLNILRVGRGYWIKVNGDCQLSYGTRNTPDNPLPAYNLKAGWNLIGWVGY